MVQIRMSTHYEAPIERVFEFATDAIRYPEWNVNYAEIKEVTGPLDRVGSRIHGVLRVLGRLFDGWGEVVEVDKPRLLKLTSSSPEGSNTILYRFTPEGTGTRAEFELEYDVRPGIFGQLIDKLFIERAIERDLKHSLENSKAFIEARTPVHA